MCALVNICTKTTVSVYLTHILTVCNIYISLSKGLHKTGFIGCEYSVLVWNAALMCASVNKMAQSAFLVY